MNEIHTLLYQIWEAKKEFYRITVGAFGIGIEHLAYAEDRSLNWNLMPQEFRDEADCIHCLQQILGGA